MLNEIGTRSRLCIWQPFPFFCPNHKSLVKTRCFTTFLKFCAAHPYQLSSNSFSSSLLLFSAFQCFSPVHIVGLLTPNLPLNIYTFQSLPHSDWWQHLQPSPNTAGTQALSTSYNIQKITQSTKTWQNPAGTQNGTSFGRAARVRAST